MSNLGYISFSPFPIVLKLFSQCRIILIITISLLTYLGFSAISTCAEDIDIETTAIQPDAIRASSVAEMVARVNPVKQMPSGKETYTLPWVDRGTYQIIWKIMPDGWAKAFWEGDSPSYAPYALTKDEYEEYQNGNFLIGPKELTIGVLTTVGELDKYVFPDRDKLIAFLKILLRDLNEKLDTGTTANLVLNAATFAREVYGYWYSMQILQGSGYLTKDVDRIVHDRIIDLWYVIEGTNNIDRQTVYQEIVRQYGFLDKDVAFQDAPDNGESVTYMAIASLLLTGEREVAKGYYKAARGQIIVRDDFLDKLDKAIDADSVTLKDFRYLVDTTELEKRGWD